MAIWGGLCYKTSKEFNFMSAGIQYLNDIDGQLLLLINNAHNSFFDEFFYTFSGRHVWIALYVALIAYCVIRWKAQGLWIVLALIASVVLADQISAHLIKPLVCRLRPTHDPILAQYVHLVHEYRGGLYGFVSSHAANCFAIATLTTLFSKDRLLATTLFTWASINAYSRMYLGVHYPGDILCGTIIGVLIALCLYGITKRWLTYSKANYNNIIKWIIPATFIATIIIIILLSALF